MLLSHFNLSVLPLLWSEACINKVKQCENAPLASFDTGDTAPLVRRDSCESREFSTKKTDF